MEEIISNELRENEKILWTGKPESFIALDTTHKQPFIRKTIITIGVVAALCVLYVMMALKNGTDIKPVIIIVALVLAACSSVNGLLEGERLQKVKYVVTNQRLMMVGDNVKDVEISSIREAQFKTDKDGHVSLLCGKRAIKAKEHLWRSLALSGAHTDADANICDSFIFYAVENPEEAKNVLSNFLPL